VLGEPTHFALHSGLDERVVSGDILIEFAIGARDPNGVEAQLESKRAHALGETFAVRHSRFLPIMNSHGNPHRRRDSEQYPLSIDP
jgi:hypothetical protein